MVTMTQIIKGESILGEFYELLKAGQNNNPKLVDLSNKFYTVIPHQIGRSKDKVRDSVISSLSKLEAKHELLQLMRDMLQVKILLKIIVWRRLTNFKDSLFGICA